MIYLETEQHRALRAEAAEQRISMAELLRRLVMEHLERRQVSPRVPKEAYLKVVGLGTSGNPDISERHDAYLAEALRRDRSR